MSELTEKRRRVHDLLAALDLDALVLRSPGNVAWYTGGGRSHVLALQDVGTVDLVVTAGGERVVVPRNEVDRMLSEELGELDPDVHVVGWAEDRVAALPSGPRVGFDVAPPGARDVAGDVEVLRRSLTTWEVDRYRSLGRDVAKVFTDVVSDAEPNDTERALAAALGGALLEIGADPIVLLVGGEPRIAKHRHPLPTTGRLGGLAMVVACARRDGLVAALTRLVAFGGLTPELTDSYARLLEVERAFLEATRPGRDVGSAYRSGAAAYAVHGFPADEAERHHQGGPIGYFARDYVATADTSAVVATAQAFAWNPSVPSLKVEDTVLAGSDSTEVLTVDPRWPTAIVGGLARPLVLSQ